MCNNFGFYRNFDGFLISKMAKIEYIFKFEFDFIKKFIFPKFI